MKKFILAASFSMLSINAFAFENLDCMENNNQSLRYSVQRIGQSDKYILTVTQTRRVIYKETLKYLDWQGEAEYTGPYSSLINNGDEFISFIHRGTFLRSTELKCEVI